MTTQGPFLYDDGPAPLHTGTPRSRQGWIIGGIVGIVLLSLAMVGLLYLVKGSPAQQATRSAEVFVASLSDGDTETAYQLLCEEERRRLTPEEVPDEYGPVPAELGRASAEREDGESVHVVPVTWADGTTGELRIVPESGPRICGHG